MSPLPPACPTQAVPRVKHLVQLAQREGVPGEAAQSVVFPGGSSSPGAG